MNHRNAVHRNRLKDSPALVERMLVGAGHAHIAVVGDFCVDQYFPVDEPQIGISVETGLPVRSVSRIEVLPGGAGNIVANLLALGVATVEAIGIVGDDMHGRELTRILQIAGADVAGLCVQEKGWDTPVYTKVYIEGAEEPRLDTGNRNRPGEESLTCIAESLRRAVATADVVIVNQQLRHGLFTDKMRALIRDVIGGAGAAGAAGGGSGYRRSGTSRPAILVDSRDYAADFPGTIRKINESEARLVSADLATPKGAEEELPDLCLRLASRWATPTIVTRGENGCIVAGMEDVDLVPGLSVPRPNDPVGAGDAFLAGTAAAIAAQLTLADAAWVGNICGAVTVSKLMRTGTAEAHEVRALAAAPAFRMRPSLAGNPGAARFLPGTQVEVCGSDVDGLGTTVVDVEASLPFRLRHAVFDHDGTISVLRQGWDAVMRRMMVGAITVAASDRSLRQEEIHAAVAELISDTTGIQTIEQMHRLRELVCRFSGVDAGELPSAAEYKAGYLAELNRSVEERRELVRRGVLAVEDVTVKGAVAFLHTLRDRGVTLYLASGSDHDDVVAEATLLGYAGLFDGGIFGSVDDVDNDPKAVVLRRIMGVVGPSACHDLVTFGDGPVEIRETMCRGGRTVGVASDEVRRYGLNHAKRERLILAGADYIISDFAESGALLAHLLDGRGQGDGS